MPEACDLYRYAFKSETNAKRDDALEVISLVFYDIDRFKLYRCGGPGQEPVAKGAAILNLADTIISHSAYHFDAVARAGNVDLERPTWIDTADWSKRLWNYPGNGFSHWCKRLSLTRRQFNGADAWCPLAEQRAIDDLKMIMKLYGKLIAATGQLAP